MKLFKKKKEISRDDSGVYLERWNLFECNSFSIKVHHILKSDHDCLHDHPWAFISLILRNGYTEHREMPVFKEWDWQDGGPVKVTRDVVVANRYKAGSLLYRKAKDKHRLELDKPAWTLVVTFKKSREWGFWTKGGWVPWRQYDPKSSCE